VLIIKIAMFGIIVTILAIVLRQNNPEYALLLTLISCVFIFYLILPELGYLFKKITDITNEFTINKTYIKILMKVVGIAYIAEFASQLCHDAGENSIAAKIELGGKILIMTVALPVMTDLIDLIMCMLSK
jgi:stage III sporulation protein AD